jgi:hypothetical protein
MTQSPEQAFAEAQDAKQRGDLPAFFRCFDRNDQLRLSANAVLGLLAEEPRVAAAFGVLRDKHAMSPQAVDELQRLVRQLMASAQVIRNGSPDARHAASSEHAVLVQRHQKSVDALVKSIPDLAAFLADAEVTFRAVHGGGIVSSTLFLGERLEQVAVQGNRAWGTRVGTTSLGARRTEDVGFVRGRSGMWRIRLLARRPRARGKSE